MNTIKNESILSGIGRAKKEGFTTEFRYEDQHLIDRSTKVSYPKESCSMIRFERYEGMLDPSDAPILFLISCKDGNRGYLSSAYGIYADAELLEFVRSIGSPSKK